MSTGLHLTDDVQLLSLHVDALELSCSVEQVPMLHGDFDELDLKLSRSRAVTRATIPYRPAATGWSWDGNAAGAEPVVVLPTAVRKGYRFALQCSDWILFVAAPRARLPQMMIQLRADYLLAAGPLAAYGAVRAWVEQHALPLVDGVAPDSSPLWLIARLDLAADVAGVNLTAADLDRFTTRARARDAYHAGDGWDWVTER
jgi:hypothetical protein